MENDGKSRMWNKKVGLLVDLRVIKWVVFVDIDRLFVYLLIDEYYIGEYSI